MLLLAMMLLVELKVVNCFYIRLQGNLLKIKLLEHEVNVLPINDPAFMSDVVGSIKHVVLKNFRQRIHDETCSVICQALF